MTLEETIRTLEAVALQQQSVAMVIDNDIFKLNTIPNAKYAVFAYTQGEHLTSVSGDLATYRLTLFYVDRLLADKSNQTQIQSTGTQVLRNILTMMSELDFQVDNMPIQPFTQQFVDECAGVYCAVSIGAANGCECMPGFTEVFRKLNAATDKANDAADRANELADNPPKIVLNDQGYFWAFYNEDTKQYVVSEYPARGEKGDPGADAAITGATASVGMGVGNPTVEVTLGGTSSKRTFAFAFDGLIPAGAVLYNGAQTLTPQQQEQARKNIGVQTEYVFQDIDKDERSMYTYNGLIFYINSNGKLSSFNEQTFEIISYDKITLPGHLYNRNLYPSIKRFIVKDDKILTFKMNSDAIILWDLNTQEKIYEATPLSADKNLWHSGFFLEMEGKVFLFVSGTGYDAVEIDFATGEVIKTISIFKDFTISHMIYAYLSYEDEDLSLFVVNNRIIKYDKSLDEFSILIDISSGTTENINVSKGYPTCIFKDPITDTNLLIFTTHGLCVNPLSDILIGKFDSTKNFVAPGGFNTDNLNRARPFAQFSENEFISRDIQIVIFNTHGYPHTYGLTLNSDYNRLGYFTKGELGVVYNRGYNNSFKVDTLPIYRRYGNDIH